MKENPARGCLFIERESSLNFLFSAARGRNVDINCGVSSRAAENKEEMWVVSGAFYKQATPNGVTTQRDPSFAEIFFRVDDSFGCKPRVAPPSQPWAEPSIPLGLAKRLGQGGQKCSGGLVGSEGEATGDVLFLQHNAVEGDGSGGQGGWIYHRSLKEAG